MTKEERRNKEQAIRLQRLKAKLDGVPGVYHVGFGERFGGAALSVHMDPWIEERSLPLQDPRICTDWGRSADDFKILWVWFE